MDPKAQHEYAQRTEQAYQALRRSIAASGRAQTVTEIARAPDGSLLLWSPMGSGRLRFSRPIPDRTHPPLRGAHPAFPDQTIELGLAFRDTYLTVDNTPLLLWRRNGCPTCEQLIRAAAERPSQVRRFSTLTRELTRDRIAADLSHGLPALDWLFRLLPPGIYRLSLDDYLPTAGNERCTFDSPEEIVPCEALREIFQPGRPKYLIATQHPSAFRKRAWSRARARHRIHPGIALFVAGLGSALLDGHHRALSAAQEHSTFACLTVAEVDIYYPMPPPGATWPRSGGPLHIKSPPDGFLLTEDKLHPIVRPFLDALRRCSSFRWIREPSIADEIERRLTVTRPLVDTPPQAPVAGVYPTWRDQPFR